MQLQSPHFQLRLLAMLPFIILYATRVTFSQTSSTDHSVETGSGTAAPEDSEPYCSRTSDPNLSQKLRVEAIKHEILLRLGLDEAPPNPDPRSAELPTSDPTFVENYRAAKEVQKVHNQNRKPCTKLDTHEKKLLAFFPLSVEGYPPIPHPYLSRPDKHGGKDGTVNTDFNENYRIKFHINLVDATSITNVIDDLKAELRLFKELRLDVINSRRGKSTWEDRVEVRLIVRPEHYLNQELRIFITHQLLTPTDGYAVFDVSIAIKEWLKRNDGLSGELELDVWIRSPEVIQIGHAYEPAIQFSLHEQTTQLILTVYEEDKSRRQAITAGYATNNPAKCEFQCCWHPLVVNFRRDYNWTWITEPESIEFNFCSGSCPQNWALEGQHVRLLDIHRRRVLDENPTAAPEPCCVPDSYRKQLFVLNIKNKTEMVWVDDAVVDSCICR